MCYIYYVGIPFELYVLSIEEFVYKNDIVLSFTTGQLNQIIIMGMMAFIAFSLGYFLSSFNPLRIRRRSRNLFSGSPYSLKILVILSFLSVIIFFYENIFAVNTYEDSYRIRYNTPAFSLLCEFVVQYGAVIAAAVILKGHILKKNFVAVVTILLIILWGIYTSDKNTILVGLLSIASAGSNTIRKKGFSFLIVIFISCVIFIFLHYCPETSD